MSTETFSRPTPFGCTQTGPNASALRTPFDGATGCGGFQRRGPTGGAPNGMPRNTRTPPGEFAAGAIRPASVRTASPAAPGRTTIAPNAKAVQMKVSVFPKPLSYSLRHSTEEDPCRG